MIVISCLLVDIFFSLFLVKVSNFVVATYVVNKDEHT